MNGVSQPSMKVAQRLAALMGWSLDQVNALYESKRPLNNEETSKGRSNSNAKSRNSRTRSRITGKRLKP
jgi:hypothetical protein